MVGSDLEQLRGKFSKAPRLDQRRCVPELAPTRDFGSYVGAQPNEPLGTECGELVGVHVVRRDDPGAAAEALDIGGPFVDRVLREWWSLVRVSAAVTTKD